MLARLEKKLLQSKCLLEATQELSNQIEALVESQKKGLSTMRIAYRKLLSLFTIVAMTMGFTATSIVSAPISNAQVQGLSIDFAAADERTYNHLVGGGQWNLGDVNADISRELNATNFTCGEIVSYLVNFTANGSQEILDLEPFTVRSQFSFDMDTSGQPGAALGEIVNVAIDQTDPAQKGDNDSVATLVSTSTTGNMFEKLAKLNASIELTDIESGDTIIVRIDVKLFCQFGERPTGTLDGRFIDSEMTFKNGSTPVVPTEKIQVGAKTVPMKNLNEVAIPRLVLSKTVTTETGSCSTAGDSITITPTQTVKYCYAVTSASNGGSNPAGPIYNLSVITDDGGQFASFDLPIASGLSDQDGDGNADDLAAGATAFASITKTFDGDQDTSILNTATVYGFDSIINPTRINASDTALVNIDAPDAAPAITVNKLTNGSDGSTIPAGSAITWSYAVTNTGNVALTDLVVTDSQAGVLVNCPSTTLAVGETVTCSATGTAIAGNYSNTGNASAKYNSTTVNASDASSYFGSAPAITVNKLTNGSDGSTIPAGSAITWSYAVTNTGNVVLTDLVVTDSQAGVLVNCPSTTLAVGETVTCSATGTAIAGNYSNTGNASAKYNSTTVNASDASSYFGSAPAIDVQKTPDAQVVLVGGSVTFTVTVTNTGNVALTNVQVVDPLAPSCARTITGLALSEVVSFTCSVSNVQENFVNVVTVSASAGSSTVNDTDTAAVTVDYLPEVTLTKTADVSTVPVTGGFVDYTLRITNVGREAFTITSLTDSRIALSASCLALMNQSLAAGAFVECSITDVPVTYTGEDTFVNTATVVVTDPEMNTDTSTASATIIFGWYGRTPGFWKNKPEAWAGLGYAPTQSIRSVFTIPAVLLKSGVLDISAPNGDDTLMEGLGYRGGSNLSGSFQILMRAAIAALLNEAYYGIYYPGASSTTALIAQVNGVLATQSRASYLALAGALDGWNNAIHSSLP